MDTYRTELIEQEKSQNTVEKYMRDIRGFYFFLAGANGSAVTKQAVMKYKEHLKETYKTSSANSMLVAINSFLKYLGWHECCVRLLKIQKRIFREESRELTKSEYMNLVETARKKKNERLRLVMETICATGIRVSELKYITIGAVKAGRADICCKGKQRTVFIPSSLCKQLMRYAGKNKILSGYIFRTKTGKPLDRSNIWHDMKNLCRESGIEPSKVFPHNLRHLFARTFYNIEKDIVKLADILGHSSVETTRIYTISSGAEHARKVDQLGLVV